MPFVISISSYLCCRLSSAVGTQIRPLQYILRDSGFSSHVRYLSPVGEGWLSAAGDYVVRDGKTVEILFDSFWADVGRDNLQPDPKGEVHPHCFSPVYFASSISLEGCFAFYSLSNMPFVCRV